MLQLCDSTLTQYYTVDTSLSPKSLVYIKFHPWRCPLCGSGQMYNDLHYRIIWSSLTAWKISPRSTYSSLPAAGNHWSYCHHSCAFPRKPYSWNHAVWSLSDWLLSLSHGRLRVFPVFLWLHSSFFFSMAQYSITWMHHSLFIHLPKDILVAFKFWKLWIKLL